MVVNKTRQIDGFKKAPKRTYVRKESQSCGQKQSKMAK